MRTIDYTALYLYLNIFYMLGHFFCLGLWSYLVNMLPEYQMKCFYPIIFILTLLIIDFLIVSDLVIHLIYMKSNNWPLTGVHLHTYNILHCYECGKWNKFPFGPMELYYFVSSYFTMFSAFFAMYLVEHMDDEKDVSDYLLIDNETFLFMKKIFTIEMATGLMGLATCYSRVAVRNNVLARPKEPIVVITKGPAEMMSAISIDDMCIEADEVMVKNIPPIYEIHFWKYVDKIIQKRSQNKE